MYVPIVYLLFQMLYYNCKYVFIFWIKIIIIIQHQKYLYIFSKYKIWR